jgi:glycogen operon protein
VLTLVLDSLRYWAEEMQVDGFRFDLATVLGRTYSEFDPLGMFMGAVVQDPALRHVKLIAEPWDVGPNGYRVGGFPRRWSEWNDQYRDTVRDFWRGTEGALGAFATRITGSSDIYEGARRPPTATVNLITSHDGYTLADLVSYQKRHNEANGEGNRDGHTDNRSWNTGVEGPTTDPTIVELRARRARTMLATLLLSQGVPMLLGGDEMGRTQGGNNNAYNQDNVTSWYDWDGADSDLIDFTQMLIELRKSHPTFRRTAWLHEDDAPGIDRVGWFTPAGKEMTESDWRAPFARSVALYLRGDVIHVAHGAVTDDDFLLMFNAYAEPLDFAIAPEIDGTAWSVIVDTATPGSDPRPAGESVDVAAFGMVVLRRPSVERATGRTAAQSLSQTRASTVTT